MPISEGNQKFYEKAEKEFLRYYSRRLSLMGDLSADNLEEYKKNEKKIAELASQLLRYGAGYELTEQGVDIAIGDKTYTVSKEAIRGCMDNEEFTYIFNEEPETFEGDIIDDKNDYIPYEEEASKEFNSNNAMVEFMTALTKMMSGMGNTNFGFQPPMVSSVSNEILTIDKKVKDIENAKNKAYEKLEAAKKEKEYLISEHEHKTTAIQKEVETLKESLEKYKAQMAEKDKAIDEFKAKADELQKNVSNMTETLQKKEETIKALTSEKEALKSESEELKKKLVTLEQTISNLNSAKSDYENTINKLKNEIEFLKREGGSEIKKKLEEANRRLGEKEKVIKDYENRVNNEYVDKRKYDTLVNEKKSLESKVSGLSKQVEDEQETTRRVSEQLKKEKSNSEGLLNLAYKDLMTRVKNNNAFNQEFPGTNRSNVILAIVGICKLKEVNDVSGRDTGNRMIKYTASKLSDNFGADNIYRVMGDQFIIVFIGKKYNEVKDSIEKVQKELYEQRIDIAYGIAIGQQCSSHKEILDVAEENMRNFKNSEVQVRHTPSTMGISNGTFETKPEEKSNSLNKGLEKVDLSDNEVLMKALMDDDDDDDDEDDDE